MARKTKKTAAAKPNKSAFVRSLAFDMPAADVISRAKTQGMKLTRNDVHAIRAIARRKTKPKASGKSAARAGVNKSAFVRDLPEALSAADVMARAKAKGIRLSAAQVYTIRANARRKGSPSKSVTSSSGPRAKQRGPISSASDSRESDFIVAALDLGLAKAESLIDSLRNRVRHALS